MDRKQLLDYLKSIIEYESAIIRLNEAIKGINARTKTSLDNMEPIYNQKYIKEDGLDVLVYQGSDIQDLDYAVYQITTLKMDFLDKINEYKELLKKDFGLGFREILEIGVNDYEKDIIFEGIDDRSLIMDFDKNLSEELKNDEWELLGGEAKFGPR